MRPPEVNLGFPYIHTKGRKGRRRRGGRGKKHGRYTCASINTCTCTIHMYHTHSYYIHTHLGTHRFKSLFRSQFDEIKCAQGGTVIDQVTVSSCKSYTVGHILVAPSEDLWLPFTVADGITRKKE